MTTAAIVLAAGGSRRLGRPKQLVAVSGRPLLDRVVASVRSWPVDDVVVVLGAHRDEITAACDLGGARVVDNPRWSEGLATSIAAGLAACDADRAFLALGDQPAVDPSIPATLVDRTGPAVVPVYRGVRANPVLVDRVLWPAFSALDGDRGGADLLRRHPEWVTEVAFDREPPLDVDTEDDVQRLRRSSSSRSASSE
ncbi:MAG: nucleotidyltransferase family protein [Acidimicrobiia bacterium]|nr:nucleotidyltransferase family protein [Acidimicrobiia bacterium]